MAKALLRIVAASVLWTCPVVLADTFYVDKNNCSAGNGGTSPVDAICAIQEAILLAEGTAGSDDILVAAGTYQTSLAVPSDVRILGSHNPRFDPPGTACDASPPVPPTTILDGRGRDPVIVIGPGVTGAALDCLEITGGLGLYPGGGGVQIQDSSVTLSRNLIDGNEVPLGQGNGGGVFISGYQAVPCVLRGNEIRGNFVRDGGGGGVSLEFASSAVGTQHMLEGNTVTGNVAYADIENPARGGGILVDVVADVTITGNLIQGNRAVALLPNISCDPTGNGGGLFVFDSIGSITRNRIEGNRAELAAGPGVYCNYSALGGGAYARFFYGTFEENEFVGNAAQGGTGFTPDGFGGGPGDSQALGGGLYVMMGLPVLTRNRITGNTLAGGNDEYVRQGAGAWVYSSSPQVEENTFGGLQAGEANQADEGGGLYLVDLDGFGLLRHNQFLGNVATARRGGGLLMLGGETRLLNNAAVSNLGDGFFLAGLGGPTAAVVANLTSTGNGGGSCTPGDPCYGLLYEDTQAGALLLSSIVWGNEQGLWNRVADVPVGAGLVVEGSDIQDVAIPGTGNLSRDPDFVTGPFGDLYLAQLPGDGKPLSRCVDGGHTTAFQAGLSDRTTRSDGAWDVCQVDMGFHYPIPAAPPPPADTDGDALPDSTETLLGTPWDDSDADDDGLPDGAEGVNCTDPASLADSDGDTVLDVFDCDSDGDGIYDGTEAGFDQLSVTSGTDTGSTCFVEDRDPSTRTDYHNADTDGGGEMDGSEDGNRDGALDTGERDPLDPVDDDSDVDGLSNIAEGLAGTDPHDADTDDDGLLDGEETVRGTDPLLCDSDADGVFDGTEAGRATAHRDTDPGSGCFIADSDPVSTTDPLDGDTDGDTCPDGGAVGEDMNGNGAEDAGESDPNDPTDNICTSLNKPGEAAHLRVERSGEDLLVRFDPAPRADRHSVFRGSLTALRAVTPFFDHVASPGPDNTPGNADDIGVCLVGTQPCVLVGDAGQGERENYYYLAAAQNAFGWGSSGGYDLDGDGVLETLRPGPDTNTPPNQVLFDPMCP